MKTRFYIVFVLFSALLSSCTTMLYTGIDVLRPAKVTFDKKATDLLVLNNSVVQPSTYGHTNELLMQKQKNVSVTTDSLAIFCLSVVNEEFNKKEFFSSVQLHLPTINPSGSFLMAVSPKIDTVKNIAKAYNANVVLSLDKIKVSDRIVEYYNEESSSFYAMLEANYESNWSVIYPELNVTQSISFKDTIYWDNEAYQRKKAVDGLPNRYNALIDGALYVGQSAMKKFVPWWDKEERYFFLTQNKVLKQGMDSVYVKNWKDAALIWENGLAKANTTLQAKLLYNIAIVYEIMGDMDKAKQYIEKSFAIYETNSVIDYNHYLTIRQYKDKLQKRIREIAEINKQLGEK